MTTNKNLFFRENGGSEHAFPALMHTELAPWWHLLSAPADYAEAADFYWNALHSASSSPPCTLLELGSGGGNNASFLKRHCELTLVDLSPEMLRVSQTLNPECEHLTGDMRTIRLGRVFDAVFIQDAISFMLTEAELEQAIQSAFVHCRPGGAALFAPDYIKETFRGSTNHGGQDDERRGMRYLEWTWDPNPDDSTYFADFAYLLRDENGETRAKSERLQLGVFRRADWMRLIGSAGFQPRAIPFESCAGGPGSEVFLGLKPN